MSGGDSMNQKDIERLYQKGQTEKSPVAIDNFILAQAKNSCRKNNTTTRKWFYSLSTAAALVLCFSIIINLQNQNSDYLVNTEVLNKSVPRKQKTQTPAPAPFQENKDEGLINDEDKIKSDQAGSTPDTELYSAPAAQSAPRTEEQRNEADDTFLIMNEEIEESPEEIVVDPIIEYADSLEQNTDTTNQPPVSLSESEKSINEEKPKALGRVSAKKEQKENKFNQQIQRVKELIESKMFEDAAELLIQLKQQYPDYDFSEIEKRISDSQ